MTRFAVRVVVPLALGGLLFACQGDEGVLSEPGRTLDLAGACKDADFSSAVLVWPDSKTQSQKLQACKTILNYVSSSQLGQAEIEVDKLLAEVFSAYHAGVLQPLSGQTLPASTAFYIESACGLVPFGAGECPTPYDRDDPADGIDADDLAGWMAVGPLFSTGTDLATALVPNGLFAVGVEEANGTFVIFSQQPLADDPGPCPGSSLWDCQTDWWDVDADANDSFTSITVESCDTFGERHVRCPPGQPCEQGDVADPLGLVTDAACTAAGYAAMDPFRKFVYQVTRPVQWVIRATPAYAPVETKFEAFSPIANADGDLRTRDVLCTIESSQYNAGSEGTVCRIFQGTTQLDFCTTVVSGSNMSSCTLVPLVPDDITVYVTAEKTGGQGAYNATSAPFTLGPADPPAGEGGKEVCFEMSPPSATQVACP